MSIFNLYSHSVYEHVNVRVKNINTSPVEKRVNSSNNEWIFCKTAAEVETGNVRPVSYGNLSSDPIEEQIDAQLL